MSGARGPPCSKAWSSEQPILPCKLKLNNDFAALNSAPSPIAIFRNPRVFGLALQVSEVSAQPMWRSWHWRWALEPAEPPMVDWIGQVSRNRFGCIDRHGAFDNDR